MYPLAERCIPVRKQKKKEFKIQSLIIFKLPKMSLQREREKEKIWQCDLGYNAEPRGHAGDVIVCDKLDSLSISAAHTLKMALCRSSNICCQINGSLRELHTRSGKASALFWSTDTQSERLFGLEKFPNSNWTESWMVGLLMKFAALYKIRSDLRIKTDREARCCWKWLSRFDMRSSMLLIAPDTIWSQSKVCLRRGASFWICRDTRQNTSRISVLSSGLWLHLIGLRREQRTACVSLLANICL